LSATLVIGIDPGSRATGWGIVRLEGGDLSCVECGVVRVSADLDLAERMMTLAEGLDGIIERLSPGVAAIEDVFVSRDPRGALKLGQARGAALAALARRGLSVTEYPPAVVKRAVTGSGRAAKTQVALMVQSILGLEKQPARDASDALAVAICHARSLRP
jgi:crossover junction endodeoxyribonuclease RuvC